MYDYDIMFAEIANEDLLTNSVYRFLFRVNFRIRYSIRHRRLFV